MQQYIHHPSTFPNATYMNRLFRFQFNHENFPTNLQVYFQLVFQSLLMVNNTIIQSTNNKMLYQHVSLPMVEGYVICGFQCILPGIHTKSCVDILNLLIQ